MDGRKYQKELYKQAKALGISLPPGQTSIKRLEELIQQKIQESRGSSSLAELADLAIEREKRSRSRSRSPSPSRRQRMQSPVRSRSPSPRIPSPPRASVSPLRSYVPFPQPPPPPRAHVVPLSSGRPLLRPVSSFTQFTPTPAERQTVKRRPVYIPGIPNMEPLVYMGNVELLEQYLQQHPEARQFFR